MSLSTDSLDILCVKNKELAVILDSIVDNETQCDYYNPNLLFVIGVNGKYISIGTVGERLAKDDYIMGCIPYRNHLFFVIGWYFDNALFEKTGQKREYIFAVSQTREDPETGDFILDPMNIQDDSFSQWTFIFEDNHFVLLEKYMHCKQSTSLISEHNKIDYPLDIVCVTNYNLFPILDSIITHEKGCDYYSPNLLFSISILQDNYILIGSIGERIVDTESRVACFEYKNHLFLVRNLDKRFFRKTGRQRNYIFSKSQTRFDEETGQWSIDTAEWFQDDSYSYWYYTYENNEFIYQSSSTFCDTSSNI
jgi:hypothetical protein